MTITTIEKCYLCGQPIDPGDPDAMDVGGGLAHEGCIEEHDDGDFSGQPDPEKRAG